MKSLLIIGAGGHGKVVAEVAFIQQRISAERQSLKAEQLLNRRQLLGDLKNYDIRW